MFKTHKIRVYPNNKQITYFLKACGIRRFAYNWGLAKWKDLCGTCENLSAWDIDKMFNSVKVKEFPWVKEVTKFASNLAIKEDLKRALKLLKGGSIRDLHFKKKGVKDSFRIHYNNGGGFKVERNNVFIPKLGWVRMSQFLRYSGRLVDCSVLRKADKWFVSIKVEVPDKQPIHTSKSENQAVGVDLGVKALATLSDGTVVEGRKVTKEFASKVRRLNKELSRRQGFRRGEVKSNNFKKTQLQLQKLYMRMTNIRDDQLHKLTRQLTQQYATIGIEDLNVAGMMKNHKLAGASQDRSFFEFRRQLEYKAKETGSKVVVADKFFASSKLCNKCGIKNANLTLSDRNWLCSNCGTHHNRDVNAAINLKNNALRNADGVSVSACGELDVVKSSMKQELGNSVVMCKS